MAGAILEVDHVVVRADHCQPALVLQHPAVIFFVRFLIHPLHPSERQAPVCYTPLAATGSARRSWIHARALLPLDPCSSGGCRLTSTPDPSPGRRQAGPLRLSLPTHHPVCPTIKAWPGPALDGRTALLPAIIATNFCYSCSIPAPSPSLPFSSNTPLFCDRARPSFALENCPVLLACDIHSHHRQSPPTDRPTSTWSLFVVARSNALLYLGRHCVARI